eukprot:snap_masked-scaffold_1-processed-gene-25.23-mRNA-1 protein AED:1.00 eAED:1.00 QI:0/0/0/0/1/1/2/0/81
MSKLSSTVNENDNVLKLEVNKQSNLYCQHMIEVSLKRRASAKNEAQEKILFNLSLAIEVKYMQVESSIMLSKRLEFKNLKG